MIKKRTTSGTDSIKYRVRPTNEHETNFTTVFNVYSRGYESYSRNTIFRLTGINCVYECWDLTSPEKPRFPRKPQVD